MKLTIVVEGESYYFPLTDEGVSVPRVLGDWTLTAKAVPARSKAARPSLEVCLWDATAAQTPDFKGRIFPKRQTILEDGHNRETFHRGILFGRKAITVKRLL